MRAGPITVMYVVRRRMGLSQQQLADEIGVGQPRISAWENRRADCSEARRQQLAKLLDVDAERLTEDA